MLLMETVMKIRRQILVDGNSVRSVSRETGLSRNTIRKYLKEDSPPTYRRQQAVKQPQLEGHQARLESGTKRISSVPNVSVVPLKSCLNNCNWRVIEAPIPRSVDLSNG